VSKVWQVWSAAIAVPERLTPSAWAEKYRVLPRGQSPRPGRWRNEVSPYLRWLMDVCVAPGVVALVVMKAAQIGVSEAMRNVLGYIAHVAPEPCGLALPTLPKGRRIVMNRIIPMLVHTEPLKALLTATSRDVQAEEILLLNGWRLHLMWSGSASAMASDPMRLAVCDEVDKFEQWVGREADPVSLVAKRLRAYGDRGLLIEVSTPTTALGKINQDYDSASVKLAYYVPCPACGKWQRLVWPQVKWEKPGGDLTSKQLAAHVTRTGAVWYECIHCQARIRDDQKTAMVRAGQWRAEGGGQVTDAWGQQHDSAETVTAWPPGTRIGVQLSALYCLWERWATMVGEFLRAQGDMAKLYDFFTETLGVPWEQVIQKIPKTAFAAKVVRATLDEGIVPAWAARLLATVDTQHDHFVIVLRAWGPEMRSQRVWHGKVQSFKELDELLFKHPWRIDRESEHVMSPSLVGIDTGGTRLEGESESRTSEVYRWAMLRRAVVRPIKGAMRGRAGLFIWPGRGFVDVGRPRKLGQRRDQVSDQLRIWWIDTHHFADEMADLIAAGKDDPSQERWLLNKRQDDEYEKQLSAVHKVPTRKGLKVTELWTPIHPGSKIDYWDAEVYQIALAYMAQIHSLPPQAEFEKQRKAQRAGPTKKKATYTEV